MGSRDPRVAEYMSKMSEKWEKLDFSEIPKNHEKSDKIAIWLLDNAMGAKKSTLNHATAPS